MGILPVISGQVAVKVLAKIGYETHHQTGSHIILRQNESPYRRLTIPNHKERNFTSNYQASRFNC